MKTLPSLTPAQLAARSLCKAIARRVRKIRPFEGGRAFGVDWPTWATCYPGLAMPFLYAARVWQDKPAGVFMPAVLNSPNYR